MGEHWDEMPQCFYTSAEKKEGKDELLSFIEETNRLFVKPQIVKSQPAE
jgi:GTP-binding protein